MATYSKMTVSDGYQRGTTAGVTVQLGTSAELRVHMKLRAKTVSSIYKALETRKSSISSDSWKNIKEARVDGKANFFYKLFNLQAGGSHEYKNKDTSFEVKSDEEAQMITDALSHAESFEVTVAGHLKAEGTSFIPVSASIWVHYTQVRINDKMTFNVIADKPDGKAADPNGSAKDVNTSDSQLKILPPAEPAQAGVKLCAIQE